MNPEGPITNFHTHCYLCDGTGAPIDYARSAVERGLAALGYSSHAPLPFPVDWVMCREELPTYREQISVAREWASDRLPIYTGLEIDYVPELLGPDPKTFPELTLDYVIGSVHFVQGPEGEQLAVDGPIDEFLDTLERGFSGDAVALVRAYYRNVRRMLAEYTPDVLGHIDVIRKNNGGNRFFDPSESWYRDEVLSCIESAAGNGCIVEVNTGGLARGKGVLYPEAWAVAACARRGIPMMVNTDAHAPDHLGHGYDRAFDRLKEAGYEEQWILTDTGWVPRPLR